MKGNIPTAVVIFALSMWNDLMWYQSFCFFLCDWYTQSASARSASTRKNAYFRLSTTTLESEFALKNMWRTLGIYLGILFSLLNKNLCSQCCWFFS
jgi:hypothetical protein